jgi:hypothetical protein
MAPGVNAILIEQAKRLSKFDKLIESVSWVESRGDIFAYNPMEGAYGALQIRQCRIDEFNKLTNSHYTLQDMYDFDKAKVVFIWYAEQLREPEVIARCWNGGPYGMRIKQTEKYWQSVKEHLDKR